MNAKKSFYDSLNSMNIFDTSYVQYSKNISVKCINKKYIKMCMTRKNDTMKMK